MPDAQRFPFIEARDAFGVPDAVPYLPFILAHQDKTIEVSGLLDTGASVNVLPYDLGIELGFVWEQQTMSVNLAGNLAPVEARGVAITAIIQPFDPVRLVFAWSRTSDIPLLLGRMNFFLEFDVCFYRSQLAFDIQPKT